MVRSIGVAAALSFCLTLAAGSAHAGVAIQQGHKFFVSGKAQFQDMNNKGDDVVGSQSLNEKDVGAACTDQEKLQKGQFVILTLNNACGPGADPDNNSIQVVNTDPFTVLATIGNVDFDLAFALAEEKKGTLKSVTVPASVTLSCVSGLINLATTLGGVFEVKYDKDGNCIESAKAKTLSGDGTLDGEAVVFDGAKGSAGKPEASLVVMP